MWTALKYSASVVPLHSSLSVMAPPSLKCGAQDIHSNARFFKPSEIYGKVAQLV